MSDELELPCPSCSVPAGAYRQKDQHELLYVICHACGISQMMIERTPGVFEVCPPVELYGEVTGSGLCPRCGKGGNIHTDNEGESTFYCENCKTADTPEGLRQPDTKPDYEVTCPQCGGEAGMYWECEGWELNLACKCGHHEFVAEVEDPASARANVEGKKR